MDDNQTITQEDIEKAMEAVYSYGGKPETLVYPKEREKEVIEFLRKLSNEQR